MTRTGVLLAAYGTPDGLEDVPRYLAHIRGHTPSREEIESLSARYAAVGGRTPLRETTEKQARLLADSLGARGQYIVRFGMKHSKPSIAEAVADMVSSGVSRCIVLPLASQFSRMSVGGYHQAVKDALVGSAHAPRFEYVDSYAEHPLLVEAWADLIGSRWTALSSSARKPLLLFTAHSLPKRVLEWSDPYPSEVERTCSAVAARLGVAGWRRAYQSAPAGAPWLGPDVAVAIGEAAKEGFDAVAVAPVGFVSDHLETFYDLDLEAKRSAENASLRYLRVPAPNVHPTFIDCLADVVTSRTSSG